MSHLDSSTKAPDCINEFPRLCYERILEYDAADLRQDIADLSSFPATDTLFDTLLLCSLYATRCHLHNTLLHRYLGPSFVFTDIVN